MKTTFSSLPPELVKEITRYLPLSSRANLRLQSRHTDASDYNFVRDKARLASNNPIGDGLKEPNQAKAEDLLELGFDRRTRYFHARTDNPKNEFVEHAIRHDIFGQDITLPKTIQAKLIAVLRLLYPKGLPEQQQRKYLFNFDLSHQLINYLGFTLVDTPVPDNIFRYANLFETATPEQIVKVIRQEEQLFPHVLPMVIQEVFSKFAFDIRNAKLFANLLDVYFPDYESQPRIIVLGVSVPNNVVNSGRKVLRKLFASVASGGKKRSTRKSKSRKSRKTLRKSKH